MTDQFVATLDKREQAARNALEAKAAQLQVMEKEKASTVDVDKVRAEIVAMGKALKELRAQVRTGVEQAVEAVTAQHLESLKAQHRDDMKVVQEVVASSTNANQAVADQMRQSMVEMGTVFVGEMAQQRQFFTEVLGNVVGAYQGVIEQNQFFLANLSSSRSNEVIANQSAIYIRSVHRNLLLTFCLFFNSILKIRRVHTGYKEHWKVLTEDRFLISTHNRTFVLN
jgi:hypothetical protein